MGRCLETGRALRGPDHPTRGRADHTTGGRNTCPDLCIGATPPATRSARKLDALLALCWAISPDLL